MSIPLAVSPSTLTPGVYLKANLVTGAANPGTGTIRVLLVSPKSSAGDLTTDTEVRSGGGPDSAATAFGTGTPGHLAAKLLYAKDPAALVDFTAPISGSGTATLNVTATGSPTADTAVNVEIAGRVYQIPWLAGQSADTWKTTAIAFIQSKTTDCPVTPVSGGSGVLTLNSKVTGRIGNDILVKAALAIAQTGTEAVAGAASLTALSGGTTDYDITNVLNAAAGKEYHFVAICTSNTDANLGTTSNVSRTKTKIGTINSGLNAKLEQFVVASTGALSAAKTGAIFANTPLGHHINCVNGRSLPSELVGHQVGSRSAAIKLDPAANRIGDPLDGIFGSANTLADNPSLPTSEDALGNGVSIVAYDASTAPYMVRPITTYSLDASGGADRRCLDLQNVDGFYIVLRDIRDNIAREFPNAKIVRDPPADADSDDDTNVVEERDVRGWVSQRLRFWAKKGVLLKSKVEEVIADGSLIVQVDASDDQQVDIVVPYKIVPGLAKFGIVANRIS